MIVIADEWRGCVVLGLKSTNMHKFSFSNFSGSYMICETLDANDCTYSGSLSYVTLCILRQYGSICQLYIEHGKCLHKGYDPAVL